MLSDVRLGSLLAILFHLAFWHMDLGYFGRGLLGSWPQADAGVVIWSLSVCSNEWQTSEKLTRLCTIPEPAMFLGSWDRTPYAMEARVLRPLLWFGLLEHRSEKIPDSRFVERHYCRKAALFDRLFGFDVQWNLRRSPVIERTILLRWAVVTISNSPVFSAESQIANFNLVANSELNEILSDFQRAVVGLPVALKVSDY